MKNKFFFSLLFACLFIFNTSCGLDVIEYYEPPKNILNLIPISYNPDLIDTFGFYYQFNANNLENILSPTFIGTEMHYRIYKDFDKAKSDVDEITKIPAGETILSNKSFEIMKNKKYQLLKKADLSGNLINDCLIPKSGTDSIIEFNPGYNSEKSILKISGIEYLPLREYGESSIQLGFNPRLYGNNRNFYNDNDIDVDTSGVTTKENTYFLVMFAVSKGQNYTFNEQYSSVMFLGILPIYNY